MALPPLGVSPTSQVTPQHSTHVHPLPRLPDSYFQLKASTLAGPAPSQGFWARKSIQLTSFMNQALGRFHSVGLLHSANQNKKSVQLLSRSNTEGDLVTRQGQIVGHVHDDQLTLTDEAGTWDLFNNPFLQVQYSLIDRADPLGQRLLEKAYQRSLSNNTAPVLRQLFPALNGEGQSIALIDYSQAHIYTLESVLSSQEYGMAPGASISHYLFPKAPSAFQALTLDTCPRTEEALRHLVLTDFLSDFEEITKQLAHVVDSPKPPDIVVISLTMERILEYRNLVYESLPELIPLMRRLELTGQGLTPQLKQLMARLTQPDTLERFKAVTFYMDSVLDNSEELATALNNYQAITHRAAERGLSIIVSAGNSGNQFARSLPLRSDALLNFLSKSQDIIVVGASDPGGTVTDTSDDRIAAFSNIGMDPFQHDGAPTCLTPGLLIPIDPLLIGQSGVKAFNNGTSLSAPWLAGLFALMRQANPCLHPTDLKQLLIQACEPSDSPLPSLAAGHGFVNPVKAIQGALSSLQITEAQATTDEKLVL